MHLKEIILNPQKFPVRDCYPFNLDIFNRTRNLTFTTPVTFIMGHSVVYELIEWAAAEVFGGDLGEAYLGTQGDTWDAQKDMALASLGAVLGLALVLVRERLQRTRQR